MPTTADYWKSGSIALGETSALSPAGVETYLMSTALHDDDTLIRVLVSPSLRVTTHTTGLPPVDWWDSADVHCTVGWDPAGTVTDIDYVDDTKFVLGWVDMHPHLAYYGSTAGYSMVWRGDGSVVSLEGRRKGDGLGVNPDVTVSMWHLDQHSVFDNVPGYTITFGVNVGLRALWRTSHV